MTEYDGVVPALSQSLTKRGYEVLTSVQTAVLAPELADADMLVSAQTGSGKTVAFGLALASTLLEGAERFSYADAPMALVVAPTRELALQVKRELEWLYEMTGATVASCVGGMDYRTEKRVLERGAHIVVGTPGRLCDHIRRGSLDTTRLKGVVLDEADEMLDLGFRDELEAILEASPKDRRTLLFSATVPRTIASLAKRYQRNAVRVETAEEHKQHVDIECRALTVATNDQENAIVNVLRYYEAPTAIVFCATRATVNHMTSRFTNRGFSVVALSGELSQSERTHALQAMRDGRARVCVATDVAARGIDLPNLELVIHADIPKNPDILKHRSGRTGRAGRKGVSVLIVANSARKRTERLLQSASIKASWGKPPTIEEVNKKDRERIFDDPCFVEPAKEEDQVFANELLARFGAEKVAAAFVALHQKGHSAPEELLEVTSTERKETRRDDFKNSVWFSLNVGRNDDAEPRWLLPLLCKAGHITKTEIGRITLHQDETHVEIKAECVDKFLEAVGPEGRLEKKVMISRMEGVPEQPARGHGKPFEKKRRFSSDKPGEKGDIKPWNKKPWDKDDSRGDKRSDKKFADKKPRGKSDSKFGDKSESKPWDKSDKSRDADKKPWVKDKSASDAGGKKPWNKSKTDGDKKPWEKTDKKSKDKKSFKFDNTKGAKPDKPKGAKSAKPAPEPKAVKKPRKVLGLGNATGSSLKRKKKPGYSD